MQSPSLAHEQLPSNVREWIPEAFCHREVGSDIWVAMRSGVPGGQSSSDKEVPHGPVCTMLLPVVGKHLGKMQG